MAENLNPNENMLVFVSYHTGDSDAFGGFVPKWARQLQEAAAATADLSPRIKFYTYEDPETMEPTPNWKSRLVTLIERCDLFIPIITANYMRTGYENIDLELREAKKRNSEDSGFAWSIIISAPNVDDPDQDPNHEWVSPLFLQGSSVPKDYLNSYYSSEEAPRVPGKVVQTILQQVRTKWNAWLARHSQDAITDPEDDFGGSEEIPAPLPNTDDACSLAEALAAVFAETGASLPVVLPKPIREYSRPIAVTRDDDLVDGLGELAALIDEKADDAILSAWIDAYLAPQSP